jgi:hypothetical protein
MFIRLVGVMFNIVLNILINEFDYYYIIKQFSIFDYHDKSYDRHVTRDVFYICF